MHVGLRHFAYFINLFSNHIRILRHPVAGLIVHPHTLALFVGYATLRIVSFYLVPHPIAQGMLVFALLLLLAGLYFKNPMYAWRLLIAEILLGGTGQFLALGGISIRTLFIYAFCALWFFHHASLRVYGRLCVSHLLFYMFGALFAVALFGTLHGMYAGNMTRAVLADAIPFTYLPLFLPAYHLLAHASKKDYEYVLRLLSVFICATAMYSLLNEYLFSSGIAVIHAPYYNWYRDVAIGKITDLHTGFFRVVSSEHILFIPIVITLASIAMKRKHRHIWRILLSLSTVVLAINFSRAYLIGIALGFVVLLFSHTWKQWLTESAVTICMLVIAYMGVNALASDGRSLGLEHVSSRFGGIVQTGKDESSAQRMLRLEPALLAARAHPIVGAGFGTSIVFFDPIRMAYVSTTDFDWGYLEMIAELGSIGLLLFVGAIVTMCVLLARAALSHTRHADMYVGILASLLALMVANIFSPILFHAFGILFLIFAAVIVARPLHLLEYARGAYTTFVCHEEE